MALPQERADLLLGLDHVLVGPDLDGYRSDGARVCLAHAEYLLLRRRDRDHDHVVLVLAPGVLSLARQHAHDGEGYLLDPDDLAERLGLAEQVERRCLPYQGDLGGAVDVLGVDRPAVRHRPVPRLEVFGRDALDHRGPVQVAVHDLRCAAYRRRRRLDQRDLARDRRGVVLADRELAAGAEPDTARGDATREDDDQVRPEALDLLGDAGLGSGADTDHGDDGGHADDDAEHRESAPELVHPERPAGNPDALPDAHAASSSSAGSWASVAAASRGSAARSSLLKRPSRNVRLRLA